MATINLDHVAQYWHHHNQGIEVVTWKAFQLIGVACQTLICAVLCHLNTFETIK